MSRAEQKDLGVASLPSNLSEALDEMEASELVREALGDHIFEWFLRNKEQSGMSINVKLHLLKSTSIFLTGSKKF